MRQRYWLAVLLPLLTGCPNVTVDVPKPTVDAATKATENVKEGLDRLGEGLSGLDPAGINRLLDLNADLRVKLESITKSLNAAAGRGMIEIADRAVQLRVDTYTGAFTVTAWVDKPENKFWLNRTLNLKTFSFGDENTNILAVRDQSWKLFCPPAVNCDAWDTTARAALRRQQDKIVGFMKTNTIVPGPEFESIDLNTSFGGVSGVHNVYLEVTPTGKDSYGKWSIRFQTVLKNSNGNREVVREFDITSEQNPDRPLHTPLPIVDQSLLVKVGT